jgi:hypothetical protein
VREGADPRSVAAIAQVEPSHVYTAALNGFAAELNHGQLTALLHNPNVEYVEEDQVFTTAATQSNATWGIDRIDQRNRPLSGTYTYTYTGSTVYAYIIDTGIRTAHTDFGGRASNVYDAFGGNGQDCNGHGTHVAGTVGGATWGVAKSVRLRGLRVLNCSGSGYHLRHHRRRGLGAEQPDQPGGGEHVAGRRLLLGAEHGGQQPGQLRRLRGRGRGEQQRQRLQLLAGQRLGRLHRGGHHLQRRPRHVLQLRELREHLRAGLQHPLGLAHQQHGDQHHQRHLDGLAARGRRRGADDDSARISIVRTAGGPAVREGGLRAVVAANSFVRLPGPCPVEGLSTRATSLRCALRSPRCVPVVAAA